MQVLSLTPTTLRNGTPRVTIAVAGSHGATWLVTVGAADGTYCNCPSWKYQSAPVAGRTCKHTRSIDSMFAHDTAAMAA